MPDVEELLLAARRRLQRVSPHEAAEAVADGALLIDTRPSEQRTRDGQIPGALVIERNVLEWRLDPASAYKIDDITSFDQRIIVFCDAGFASSLAAASLQDLGLTKATDLEGGFQAWRSADLPVVVAEVNHTDRAPTVDARG